QISFEKWHGCRNDFIVLRMRQTSADEVLPSLVKAAPRLCSRDGSGIGADGILVLHEGPGDPLRPVELSIVNSDGSLARNCGNGLRCAGASIVRQAMQQGKSLDEFTWLELPVMQQNFVLSYMAGDGEELFFS